MRIPTFIWTKGEGKKALEVVGDARQAEELTALGFAQKLTEDGKPVPGPTDEDVAAQLAAQVEQA